MDHDPSFLPFHDAKPVGAADFYFAINATFRFVLNRFGLHGLRRYWNDLGTEYFAPVTARWRQDGLAGVANYWRAFFAAEPGAEVRVLADDKTVTVQVDVCPAIKHLREHGREIVPCFCHHCYFVSDAIGRPAGLTVRLQGGNGSCRQTFFSRDQAETPQDLDAIEEAK